jgi:serine/threonine-protein kinase
MPSLREKRETVPLNVERALEKALAKLPADRWASAGQFAAALAESPSRAFAAAPAQPTAEPGRLVAGWGSLLKWAAAAVVLVGIGFGLGQLLKRQPPSSPYAPVVVRRTLPTQGALAGGMIHRFALSPDGQTMAYMNSQGMVIQRLDQEEPAVLSGVRGSGPFFSPDGQWIAYGAGSTLFKVPVGGGPPEAVPGTQDVFNPYHCGATWRNDSTVIFVGNDIQIWEAREDEGEPRLLIELADPLNEIGYVYPQAIAEGRKLVYTVMGSREYRVVVEDLDKRERKLIAEDATYGRYVPTGHILYADRGGRIYAVPFDPELGEKTGPPFVVETGVRVPYGMGAAWFAVSEAGTFAFVRGSDYENHVFVWLNQDGEEIGQIGPPLTTEGGKLSPDGRSILAFVAHPGTADIYAIDTETGRQRRITHEPEIEDNPVWSPDGGSIAYHWVSGAGAHEIRVKEIHGAAPPRTIYSTTRDWLYLTSWSSTGWLALRQAHPERGMDLYAVHADSVDHVLPVAVTEAWEGGGQFSPDGRWLAYVSNETGRSEVYVVPFPDLGWPHQITQGGGGAPRFSGDSDEFSFGEGGTRWITRWSTRATASGEVFTLTDRQPLASPMDPHPDGERFLDLRNNPDSWSREIHVVVNWFERLKELERR